MFEAVQNTGLQGGIDFAKCHRCCVCPHRVQGGDIDRRLNGANFQTFEVFGFFNGRAIGHNVPVPPAIPPAKNLKTGLFEFFFQFGAEVTIECTANMVEILPEERQIKHTANRYDAVVNGGSANMHCRTGTKLHGL